MTDRDQLILRLYGQGLLLVQIAERVGMRPNSIGQVLKRLGVARPAKPQKKIKAIDNAAIIKRWDEGLSTSAIAERYGLSVKTVAKVLTDAGIDIASAHRTRYDGRGGTARRSGNAFARIAAKT